MSPRIIPMTYDTVPALLYVPYGMVGGMGRQGMEGFTLLEVLIALGILVLTLLWSLTLVMSIVAGNLSAQRLTKASVLALQQLETLQNLPLPNLTATAGCPTTVSARVDVPPMAPDDAIFTRYYCVTAVGGAARQIDVYVQYRARGSLKTLRMSTIRAI